MEVPRFSGSIPALTLEINFVYIYLVWSFTLLKKQKTAFWATTCNVVWFEMTYRKLLLLSISKFNAHLSIRLNKISALLKVRLAWSNADSTLLRHAYSTLPYCNTLAIRALTSYNFTRTFDIPSNLQFDLIA